MNRKEAIEAGSIKYQGKPCKHCGGTERFVSNRGCTYCAGTIHQSSYEVKKRYEQSNKGKATRKKINDSETQQRRLKESNVVRVAAGEASKYYHANKDRWRNNEFKRKYGITVDDYNQLLTEQEHSCKVCGKHESELDKALCVDHCHTHGHVRALLCSNCNLAFGLLFEDINIMKKMIEYAQEHS